jgi:hypothetical protein
VRDKCNSSTLSPKKKERRERKKKKIDNGKKNKDIRKMRIMQNDKY